MTLNEKALAYLKSTFDLDLVCQDWGASLHLPLFIKSSYEFSISKTELGEILFISDKLGHSYIEHLNLIHLLGNTTQINRIIFVLQKISAYDFKKSLENKISLIIIDKQIFVPFFGLLYKPLKSTVYYPKTVHRPGKISASTLHILMIILNKAQEKITQMNLVKWTGFSRMTLSRALKELESLGFIGFEDKYKAEIHLCREILIPSVLKQHLNSPIDKTITVSEKSIPEELNKKLIVSSESELAKKTILGEPPTRIYAISKKEFEPYEENLDYGLKTEMNMIQLEIWKYKVPTKNGSIDPWALYLSLIDHEDERIQVALKTLDLNA
jgi:hypothetical protein